MAVFWLVLDRVTFQNRLVSALELLRVSGGRLNVYVCRYSLAKWQSERLLCAPLNRSTHERMVDRHLRQLKRLPTPP